jgi:adenylate cyclase
MEATGHFQRRTIEDNNLARRMIEEAIAMCPGNPMGYVDLGWVHFYDYLLHNTNSLREPLEKGIELAQKALAMDESIANAHGLLCILYSFKREHEKAVVAGERAMALNPGGSFILLNYANSLTYACRPEEAIPIFQKAIRLNPFGPFFLYSDFAIALRNAKRFEESIPQHKKAIQGAPENIRLRLGLAATYSMMGREKEARAEAAEVLKINPKFSLNLYAKTLPFKNQSENDQIVTALRKAGLK